MPNFSSFTETKQEAQIQKIKSVLVEATEANARAWSPMIFQVSYSSFFRASHEIVAYGSYQIPGLSDLMLPHSYFREDFWVHNQKFSKEQLNHFNIFINKIFISFKISTSYICSKIFGILKYLFNCPKTTLGKYFVFILALLYKCT